MTPRDRNLNLNLYLQRVVLALGIALFAVVPARAQTPTEQRWANGVSYVAVGASLALDTKASWDSPNRPRALILQGVRVGATIGATTLLKHFIPSERPCSPSCGNSDPNASFPSGHTALSFQALGGPRLAFAFSLGVTTATGRVVATRHRLVDVLAGAGIGFATSFIR